VRGIARDAVILRGSIVFSQVVRAAALDDAHLAADRHQ